MIHDCLPILFRPGLPSESAHIRSLCQSSPSKSNNQAKENDLEEEVRTNGIDEEEGRDRRSEQRTQS